MQSGISASAELQSAFQQLVSSPSQRALLVTIDKESLTPTHALPASSPDFFADLTALTEILSQSPSQAAYILLRRYPNAPDGFIAVTFVPDSAPVRQKMLFASTRLALVRELGAERFREQVFATTVAELSKEGWERHDASGALQAPLTEEEEVLKGVRDAEAEERGGTKGRPLATGGKLQIAISDEASGALEQLKNGEKGALVVLCVDVKSERVELSQSITCTVQNLAEVVGEDGPRYAFYNYEAGDGEMKLVFIFTCPNGAKVRERMVYASSKEGVVAAARTEIGLDVAKKVGMKVSPEG